MNCERFNRLIDEYLDGELAESLLAEFHAHRLACRRCGRSVSMLEAAGDVIANDRYEPGVSADFADRVVAELPAALRAGRRPAWLVRLTAGAAGLAAAAAIMLAVFLSQQLPTKDPGHAIAGTATEVIPSARMVVTYDLNEDPEARFGVLDASCLSVLDEFETMIWMYDYEP